MESHTCAHTGRQTATPIGTQASGRTGAERAQPPSCSPAPDGPGFNVIPVRWKRGARFTALVALLIWKTAPRWCVSKHEPKT